LEGGAYEINGEVSADRTYTGSASYVTNKQTLTVGVGEGTGAGAMSCEKEPEGTWLCKTSEGTMNCMQENENSWACISEISK
jgi:hypothetical protein